MSPNFTHKIVYSSRLRTIKTECHAVLKSSKKLLTIRVKRFLVHVITVFISHVFWAYGFFHKTKATFSCNIIVCLFRTFKFLKDRLIWRSINVLYFIHFYLVGTRDTVPVPMTQEQVQQCKQNLKELYRTNLCKIQTDPLDLNTLLALDDIFTSLTLVEEVLGKEKKKPITIENLLETEVNGAYPKRLLLQGEGGAGKTTLCSKIAWEWVNGRHFTEFEMVLVIPLRTSKKRTVGDIAKSYMSDSNFVNPSQLNAYILSNPEKVFLLFDGFDEVDAGLEDQCDIIQILTLKRFKSCKVLVTARPWKADLIRQNPDLRRAYAFITVEGFSKANISVYIHKFFTRDATSAAELIQLMEDNDVISENMAPFPIYTAMLCLMWKDFDSERRKAIQKLQTFSQLFDEMIGFLTDHYISKGGEGSVRDRRQEVRKIIADIGDAAFKGVAGETNDLE